MPNSEDDSSIKEYVVVENKSRSRILCVLNVILMVLCSRHAEKITDDRSDHSDDDDDNEAFVIVDLPHKGAVADLGGEEKRVRYVHVQLSSTPDE